MTVKLTPNQLELLRLLGRGERDGITNRQTANSLSLKGLAKYDFDRDVWSITEAGRALLSPEAPASSKEEGE